MERNRMYWKNEEWNDPEGLNIAITTKIEYHQIIRIDASYHLR
jgi:hypothetical protein